MKMDETVDIIRKRFGFYSVQRGLMSVSYTHLKEAKKIYSYDTLTEHMWFGFYKMLFCRQRNNLTTTGRALAYIFIIKKTDNGRCCLLYTARCV